LRKKRIHGERTSVSGVRTRRINFGNNKCCNEIHVYLSSFTSVYASPKIALTQAVIDSILNRTGRLVAPRNKSLLRTIPVVTMPNFTTAAENAGVLEEERQWFALQVDIKKAARIETHLQQKGFETFTPIYAITRQWCDRKRTAELPLFPGYMFARLDCRARLPVLVTPGVFGIVSYGKQPAPICESEISSLKDVARSGLPFHPWPYLAKGERVTITRGALTGLTGIVVVIKKSLRVVLCIDLIQRAVAVEVDADVLSSVTQKVIS
jgi:transcription antitermination factor NusG